MPNYKLGKLPPVVDSRTLLFGAYLTPQLPAPPAQENYGQKVATWPMYGNDQYGDCTCAAVGHMIQNWTATAKGEVTPPLQSIMSLYEHFVGTPPPPDAGCSLLVVLRHWKKAGVDGHTIQAYALLKVGDEVQAKDALWCFGTIYIGLALPDFAVPANTDLSTIPWVVPASGATGNAAKNPNNGHCVPAVAYDDENLYVVTWGAVKSMSWEFYTAYSDEAFAVLSQDFIDANGQAPQGFDMAALEKDLSQIKAAGA